MLQAYLRLVDALSSVGLSRGPDETPRTLAERLGSVPGTTLSASRISVAIDLLERECYGVEPLISTQTASAVFVFDELAKSVKLATISSPGE